jgi:hypothetical protein
MRLKPRLPAALFLLLWVLTAEGLAAQATTMPTFYAPTRGFGSWEFGVSLSRPGGGATGLEARWGAALDRADLNFRGGYVEPRGEAEGTFAFGAEARVPVLGRSPTFPLDGAFILGLGYLLDPEQVVVPLGLSLGRRLTLDPGFHVTPYVQPTVVFAGDADFAVGLGLDIHIRGIPDIRLAWAFVDWDGFSVGGFWPR